MIVIFLQLGVFVRFPAAVAEFGDVCALVTVAMSSAGTVLYVFLPCFGYVLAVFRMRQKVAATSHVLSRHGRRVVMGDC